MMVDLPNVKNSCKHHANKIQRRLTMHIFSRSDKLKCFLFLALTTTQGNFFGCSDSGGKKKGYESAQKELLARILYYTMPG